MNIPVRSELGKKIRFAFLSSPNCTLVSADLSQIEMRWAAHGSGDPTMIRVFHEGLDIHATTACNIFGRDYNDVMSWDQSSPQFKKWKAEERAPSKNLGFGVLYGLTAPGLQRNIFNESSGRIDWTEEKCQGFIDKFFTVYPGLRTLMDIQHRRAQRYAMVWDAFGRPRMVPEGRSAHTRVRNEGLRKAGNHYEQSSAQGTIKLAMAEIHPICEELCQDYRCFPLVQVHDQLIFDVDNEIAQEFGLILQDVMQKSSPLDVPVLSSLDTAERWGAVSVSFVGKKFFRLLILRHAAHYKVECRCDCGIKKTVYMRDILIGRTKSCGCWKKEASKARATKHGMSRTSEYNIWCSLISRCTCANDHAWDRYGGRGIKVCTHWLKFENFISDVGPRPSLDHSLDRRDNDGDYCPENCYWATRMEQAKNTRTNVFIEFEGERLHLSEWARRKSISLDTIRSRIRKGCTPEQIFQPMGTRIII